MLKTAVLSFSEVLSLVSHTISLRRFGLNIYLPICCGWPSPGGECGLFSVLATLGALQNVAVTSHFIWISICLACTVCMILVFNQYLFWSAHPSQRNEKLAFSFFLVQKMSKAIFHTSWVCQRAVRMQVFSYSLLEPFHKRMQILLPMQLKHFKDIFKGTEVWYIFYVSSVFSFTLKV